MGPIATGESVTLELRMQNGLSEPFEFAEVKSSCSCRSLDPFKGTVGPGEFISFSLALDVPKHARGSDRGGIFEFFNASGVAVGVVDFSCDCPNYVGFKADLLLARSGAGAVDLDVLLTLAARWIHESIALYADRLASRRTV